MAKAFLKLTRPAMRKLLPGGKIMEHGITFERLANGDGSVITVNVMVDGQRIHRVIGRESDGTTRTQAEAFIEKSRLEASAKAGSILPTGRKIALGFREAAARYLHRLVEEGGKDLVMKRRRCGDSIWSRSLAITPLSQISTFDVERYKKSRVGEGAKVGTVNRELAALSHIYSTKGLNVGWIDKRPAKITRYAEEQRQNHLSHDRPDQAPD